MCLSDSPNIPAAQPIPQAPQEQDAAFKAAQSRNKRQAAAINGYQGTVLSGPLGSTGGATPGPSSLLGG
jgi:hypothetical protein